MRNVSKKEFWHERQDGRCYLRITYACRSRGGEMGLGPFLSANREVTWEHLVARCDLAPDERSPVLLACAACNARKGSARVAKPTSFALAIGIETEWLRQTGNEPVEAGKRLVSCYPGSSPDQKQLATWDDVVQEIERVAGVGAG